MARPTTPQSPRKVNPKLERSSLEAYAGIVVGIVIGAVPMTWYIKALLFTVIFGLACDVVFRSPWTSWWSRSGKVFGCLISLILVAGIGYRPILNQYRQDQSPKSAVFSVDINSLIECDVRDPSFKDTAAYLVWVKLENTGAPSVAKDWSLTATMPNGVSRVGQLMLLSDASDPFCGRVTPTDQDLESKTESKEVIGIVRGRLAFFVDQLPKTEAVNDNTKLTITVKNGDGTMFSGTKPVGSIGPRITNPPAQSPPTQ